MMRIANSNKELLIEHCTSQVGIDEIKMLTETEAATLQKGNLTKLYKTVVEKREKIDYESISESKGRVSKYSHYQHTKDVITTMEEMLSDAGIASEKVDELNQIKDALMYLEKYEVEFAKSYGDGNNFIAMLYDNVLYSIITAISIFISVVVTFIKDHDTNEIEATIDDVKRIKKREWGIFNVLRRFNNLSEQGKTYQLLKRYKTEKGEVEEITENLFDFIKDKVDDANKYVAIALLVGLFMMVIREAIFRIYYIRQKLSIQLKEQANLIKLNTYKVRQDTTKTKEEKEKIIEKQNRIAHRLIKWSNRLAVKAAKSEDEASQAMDKDDQDIFH